MKTKKEIMEQITRISQKAVGGTDKAAEMVKALQSKGVSNVEVTEDELDPMDFNKGQSTQEPHQVGPSSNDGYGVDPGQTPGLYQDGMDEGEMTEKFESKSQQRYFFAKCGDGKTSEQKKWCKRAEEFAGKTKDFKKLPEKVKESIIEKSLQKIVEKHVLPRMTKKEFLNTLSEQGIIVRPFKNSMIGFADEPKLDKPTKKLYTLSKEETMEQGTKTAPPKIKPGTKEKPGTSDPFKNPKHQPKPKATTKAPKSGSVKIPDYLEFDQLKINFKDQ